MSNKRKGAKLTHHGASRMKQRSGISSNMAGRMAQRALKHGLARRETKGELRKWLDERNLSGGKTLRVYGGMAYIFHKNTLITTISLPEECRQHFSEYVDAAAYNRYLAYQKAKSKNNDYTVIKQAVAKNSNVCVEDTVCIKHKEIPEMKEFHITKPAEPYDIRNAAIRFAIKANLPVNIVGATYDFYMEDHKNENYVVRYRDASEDTIQKIMDWFEKDQDIHVRMICEA